MPSRSKSKKTSLNYNWSFNVAADRKRVELFTECCRKLGFSRAEILRMLIEEFIEQHR